MHVSREAPLRLHDMAIGWICLGKEDQWAQLREEREVFILYFGNNLVVFKGLINPMISIYTQPLKIIDTQGKFILKVHSQCIIIHMGDKRVQPRKLPLHSILFLKVHNLLF